MNKRNWILALTVALCLLAFTGCGEKEKTEEGAVLATTEAAKMEAETENTADKRQQFEELMRENTSLWNTYHALLQEVAYYDVLQQDEVAAETSYKSAEEKLNETREERPLRFRPSASFEVAEATEEELPEIPDEELDQWIRDLTEQNDNIREQIEILEPKAEGLRERYGAEN